MKKLLISFLSLFCATITLSFASEPRFEIKDGKFIFEGEPIQLICGEMHYPRIPREYWEDRIVRAKAMGLNTISTCVFWNIHERQEGKFDFTGQADIAEFVRLAAKHDMFILLRPGPYICAEWDYGGYPIWLMEKKDIEVRSRDPKFLEYCARYVNKLGEQLAPMSINNGGNIVMVQVENEYGSYSNDKVYLAELAKNIEAAGFNAPLMTCDGGGQMQDGHLPGVFPAVNGAVGRDIMTIIDRFQPGGPYFVAEFYPAWFDVWGKRHSQIAFEHPTAQLEDMLKNNVSVSLYMFHGGTNFAYTNGANNSNGFEPQPTSYDYDAPLGEWGNAYPKYYAMRDVIQKYTKKPLPAVPADNPRIAVEKINLTRSMPLAGVFGKRVKSDTTLTMEELGQDFGYIHYQTTITDGGKLTIRQLRDYAVVMVDGVRVGSLDRRHLQNSIIIEPSSKPRQLEILVENVGRVNYGSEMLYNNKGITEGVALDDRELHGWTITSLPLYDETFAKARFTKMPADTTRPHFLEGRFVLDSLGDTFLDMGAFTKGAVWVNGHSIGKFWSVGPQQTLYVPAPWLKKGENSIVIFEMEPTSVRTLSALDEPILDVLGRDICKTDSKQRVNQGKEPILDSGDMILEGQMAATNDWQEFDLGEPKTMRHLCIEFTSSWNDNSSSLRDIELYDQHGKLIDKSRWSVFYVSSEDLHMSKGIAENALDSDPSTLWLAPEGLPGRLIIDLGSILSVSKVRMLGRSGTWISAQSKDFKLYGRPQFFLF